MDGIVNSWINVLTHPSIATFDQEKTGASDQKTLYGIIIAAIVSAILGAILLAIVGAAALAITGLNISVAAGTIAVVQTFIRTLVNTIIEFYVFAWLVTFVAGRLFGGTGDFRQQAYLISLFFVPLIIISAILAFIPIIGWLIAFILGIYGLFLTTFAVQSEQKIGTGQAVVTWIVAGIVTGIVISIVTGITFGWL